MNVNENVYGNKNLWPLSSGSTHFQYNNIKVPYFTGGGTTWHDGVLSENLPKDKNEIDLTVCPWGVGAEARFNQLRYCYPSTSGKNLVSALEQYSIQPLLIITNNRSTLLDFYATDRNYKLNVQENYLGSSSYFCSPVVDFNYQGALGVACLFVANANIFNENYTYNSEDFKHVFLDNYYNEDYAYNYKNYPVVLAGYMGITGYKDNTKTERETSAFQNGDFSPIVYRNLKDMSYINATIDNALLETYVNTEALYLNVFDSTQGYQTKQGVIVFGGIPTLKYSVPITRIRSTPEETFLYNCNKQGQNHPAITYLCRDDDSTITIQYSTSGTLTFPYYKNMTKEEALKEFAFVGFWFTDNIIYIDEKTGVNCESQHIYAPVFDDNGVTTGKYKIGVDASNLPNASWENVFNDNSMYDPSYTGTPEEKDDNPVSIIFPPFDFQPITRYIMTFQGLLDVIATINTIPDYNDVEDKWYGLDPGDFILSCYYYPLPLTAPSAQELKDVIIGQTPVKSNDVQLTAYTLGMYKVVDMGRVTLVPFYHDYRDFSPFTTYTLYLPYIGTYDLDPSIFLGHELQVTTLIDFNTKTACTSIMRDRLVYDYIQAPIGESVPLTAVNIGQYYNALATTQAQLEKSRKDRLLSNARQIIGLTSTYSSGTPEIKDALFADIETNSTFLQNDYAVNQLEFKIENSAPQPITVSNAGGACNLYYDSIARIVITRPYSVIDYKDFSQVFGAACFKTGFLGDFSGFTVATNILYADADGCTSGEYSEISTLLINGVVLP